MTAWTGNDARVLSYSRAELAGRTDEVFHNIEANGLVLYGDRAFLRMASKPTA